MNLSDLSEDERAVYLAAFGAFVGCLVHVETVPDRYVAAKARAMKAVRWFRLSKKESLDERLELTDPSAFWHGGTG